MKSIILIKIAYHVKKDQNWMMNTNVLNQKDHVIIIVITFGHMINVVGAKSN